MGYRHRFATVSKTVYNTVKDMTPEQLKEWVLKNHPEGWYAESEDEGFFNHYQLLGQKEIFDFGKDCWFTEALIKRISSVFTNADVVNSIEPLSLCTKADFEFVINEMRKHIHEYFKECLETYTPEQMKHHFHEKMEEWGDMTDILGLTDLSPERAAAINSQHYPYNMDLNREGLVSSWLYEYEIFELVLLYRMFDWDNTVLLFYGW